MPLTAQDVGCTRSPWSPQIALQFPDALLGHAVAIAARLQAATAPGPQRFFVLADTTYGRCAWWRAGYKVGPHSDLKPPPPRILLAPTGMRHSYDVDEVAAEHVQADLVVHYGPAALTATARLPVLFVFGKAKIDLDACIAAVCAALPGGGPLLVTGDLAYAYAFRKRAPRRERERPRRVAADRPARCLDANARQRRRWAHLAAAVVAGLAATGRYAGVAATCAVEGWRLDGTVPAAAQRGRWAALPDGATLDQYRIVYLGGESSALNNVLLTHAATEVCAAGGGGSIAAPTRPRSAIVTCEQRAGPRCRAQVYSFNPDTGVARLESADVNRTLRRRYGFLRSARTRACGAATLHRRAGSAAASPMPVGHYARRLGSMPTPSPPRFLQSLFATTGPRRHGDWHRRDGAWHRCGLGAVPTPRPPSHVR